MQPLKKAELIGLDAEVIQSTNKALVGIKGKIIDETKNMLLIGNKKITKSQVILKIKDQLIDGKTLVGRSEDRLKK
jgi:ribonuclease P protein subunit POP4